MKDLKELSNVTGAPVSEIIRRAAREYLEGAHGLCYYSKKYKQEKVKEG